jgi:hypothetical protein
LPTRHAILHERGHFLYSQGQAAVLIRQLPPVGVVVTHNSPAGIHERDEDIHWGNRKLGMQTLVNFACWV